MVCALPLETTQGLTIETWIYPEAFSQFAFPVYAGKDSTEGFGFVIQNNLVSGEGYISIMLGGVQISVTRNGARLPYKSLVAYCLDTGRFYMESV